MKLLKDEIFKHFSGKITIFKAKLKIKHSTEIQAFFNACKHPGYNKFMYQKRCDNLHVSYAIHQLACITWWYI